MSTPIDKNPGGRPTKGDAVRSAMVSVRVEPWVVAAMDEDRQTGESRADVLTRWAGQAKYEHAVATEEDNNANDEDS